MMLWKKRKKEIVDLTEWHKLDPAIIEAMHDLTIRDLKAIAKNHNWSVEILIRENEEEKNVQHL